VRCISTVFLAKLMEINSRFAREETRYKKQDTRSKIQIPNKGEHKIAIFVIPSVGEESPQVPAGI
jgi:hypothetical protein